MTLRLQPLFPVVLCLAAAPAQATADCPIRADLAAGITVAASGQPVRRRIQVVDGVYSATLQTTRAGHAIEAHDSGTHALAVSHSEMRVDGTLAPHRAQSTTYHDDLSDLDRLDTVGGVQSRFTLTSAGHPDRQGVMRWQRVDAARIDIGGCAYWAQTVEVTTELEGAGLNRAQALYLPELSAVLTSAVIDPAGELKLNLAFDQISVERPQ